MDVIRFHLLNTPKIDKYPVKLICTWHIKNMGSDLDNKSLKSVLDQMQLSGVLENDNCKHISEITHKAVKDERDFLEIEVLPLQVALSRYIEVWLTEQANN